MTHAQLVNLLRSKFYRRLDVQTNWGRNQVTRAFEEALTETLAAKLDGRPATSSYERK